VQHGRGRGPAGAVTPAPKRGRSRRRECHRETRRRRGPGRHARDSNEARRGPTLGRGLGVPLERDRRGGLAGATRACQKWLFCARRDREVQAREPWAAGGSAGRKATRPGAAPKRIVNLTYEGVAQSAAQGAARRATPEPEARSTARTVLPSVNALHGA
jgi:hypothetical protein